MSPWRPPSSGRTAAPPQACEALRAAGLEPEISARTGLLLDPYFSATKLAWLLDHVPGARARAERGELAFGTIDSWLLFKLTAHRRHVTDATNASRTLFFNLRDGAAGTTRLLELLARAARLPAGDRGLLPGARRRDRDRPRWRQTTADGHRRRPAGGAVRPGLLHARHGQEHLRHRLLRAHAHRRIRPRSRATAC